MESINGAAALYLSCMAGTPKDAFVVIPGAAMVVVALVIRKSNLTKEVFDRVKEALAKRHAGEEVDITEFEEIFE